MDHPSETDLREAEAPDYALRERDEKAPEGDVAEAPEEAQPDAEKPEDKAPPKKTGRLWLVGLVIAALVAAGGGYLIFRP